MFVDALANGMWGGPLPDALAVPRHAELKVVQRARPYVSARRVRFVVYPMPENPRHAIHSSNVIAHHKAQRVYDCNAC